MTKLAITAVLLATSGVFAADYYYKGSGNVNATSSWSLTTDGTGASPANFTTAGNIFNIQIGQSATYSNLSWTISGAGSKLRLLGNSTFNHGITTTSNFTFDLNSGSNYLFSGTSIANMTIGTAAADSIFRITNSSFSSQIDGMGTFGNLEIDRGSGASGFTPGSITTLGDVVIKSAEVRVATGSTVARTWSIGRNVLVSSGAIWNLNNGSSAATSTTNITGGITNTGTISRSSTGTSTINFAGTANADVTWGTVTATANVNVNSGRTVTFLDAFTSSGTLTLTNAGTLIVGNGGATGSIDSVTNTGTIKFNRNNAYSYAGVISSTGSFEQIGSGTTTFNAAQTYAGTTTVTNGKLIAGSAGTFGAVPGSAVDNIFVNGGTLGITGADYSLGSTRRIVLGPTTGSGTGTFEVDTGVTMTLAGVVKNNGANGTGALTKTGAGTLVLSNSANSYTGATLVSAGTLSVTGNLADSTDVEVAGGTYDVAVSDTVDTVKLTSGTISGAGTLTGTSYDVLSGNISAVLAGTGDLLKESTGTVSMSGSHTYTGDTLVWGGTLNVTGTLANATDVDVDFGGTYTLGQADTVASVTLNDGSITGSTLTSGAAFAVKKGSISAPLDGSVGLNKTTSNTVTLGGSNTYTGTTTVAAGTLSLATTGSIASSPTIDVQSGATLDVTAQSAFTIAASQTLKGNGTVAGNTTIKGTLAPGASAGKLTFSASSTPIVTAGNLTLGDGALGGDGATSIFEVDGTSRGVASGYDAVDVAGALTYDGTLNVNFNSAFPSGTSFDLFNFGSQTGRFDAINITGTYLGSLAYVGGVNGTWSTTISGLVFTFTGDDGVLSLSTAAVPEPLTAAGVLLLTSRVLGRRNRASL